MHSEENAPNYEALTDEALLVESLIHPKAFEVIVKRYQAAFLRKAQAVLHDDRDSEDAVADTFVKIYLNAKRFVPREGASFSSWAYRILMNTSLSRHRARAARERVEAPLLDAEFADNLAPADVDFERQTLVTDVRSALAKLPQHFSRILTYFYIEGRPQREIARLEGLSLAAVKTRIHRAKQEFRDTVAYDFPSFLSPL